MPYLLAATKRGQSCAITDITRSENDFDHGEVLPMKYLFYALVICYLLLGCAKPQKVEVKAVPDCKASALNTYEMGFNAGLAIGLAPPAHPAKVKRYPRPLLEKTNIPKPFIAGDPAGSVQIGHVEWDDCGPSGKCPDDSFVPPHDVPPIEENMPTYSRTYCADKTRFLLTSEDGMKHCLRLVP
jgi:hypothetical protein